MVINVTHIYALLGGIFGLVFLADFNTIRFVIEKALCDPEINSP